MSAIVIEEKVRIPEWVTDLDSFRRWCRSDDFPEHGWFSYLNGELWVDLSMEKLVHNQVKGVIAVVVGGLVMNVRLGQFLHDRMRLAHTGAGLSTEPDGMFVSWDSLQAGRVVLAEGLDTLEVEGTPDMVLEVISPSSVEKDSAVLLDLYWRAGIPEYWLVDVAESLTLDIFRRTARKYVAARKQAGWVKSHVFGKSFRLSKETNPLGYPEFALAIR
jgi:Uma2 family endonuclease